MSISPSVAIGDDFLTAFSKLNNQTQRKVKTFVEKFRVNPTSSAINYEKIHDMKDDKVRTVEIDKKYRAIIIHPKHGNIYLLAWVDNHDEAHAWARNKTFEVNLNTNSLQIYSIKEVEKSINHEKNPHGKTLFAKFKDEELISIGVPDALLPSIRAIHDLSSLRSVIPYLPKDVGESIALLAEGTPINEIIELISTTGLKSEDIFPDEKLELDNSGLRRNFVAIKSNDELALILDAPLEKWRTFLHPSQQKLIHRSFNGPARVLGGPGTGKTVVAMHRCRQLAKVVFKNPNDRILFTTFTANLADEIRKNLRSLCGDEFSRIEVTHIHGWAMQFMKNHGVNLKVATDIQLKNCWEQAISTARPCEFDFDFLRLEWENVVLPNGAFSLKDYLSTSRVGRGKPLTKQQRARAWVIFQSYMDNMARQGLHEWQQVILKAQSLASKDPKFKPYNSIIIDESQDLSAGDWKLIRTLVPESENDIFIVGDAHQRIYGTKSSLGDCGINIKGRSSKLKINYRTTEQIRAWAVQIIKGIDFDDLDGGKDDSTGYVSILTGDEPEVKNFGDFAREKKYLLDTMCDLLKTLPPEHICIGVRNQKMLDELYKPMLDSAKITSTILGKRGQHDEKGIRLATMHRIKGMEFPVIFLCGVNEGIIPRSLGIARKDLGAKADHEQREKSLLFVAATRAREKLIVTSFGKPSSILPKD